MLRTVPAGQPGHLRRLRRPLRPARRGPGRGQRLRPQRRRAVRALPPGARVRRRARRFPLGHAGQALAARPRGGARAGRRLTCLPISARLRRRCRGELRNCRFRHPAGMDAASLLTGLLLGALLATAATLGVVALLARRRPDGAGPGAGARVPGPPAPAARRHGARPRHRPRRAARADGHRRPGLGAAASRRRRPWSRRCARRTSAAAGARCSCAGWSRWPGCSSTATSSSSPSAPATQGAGVRPDLVVTLADGRQVVVDAKVPFTGYIEAVQATDQAVRGQRVAAARPAAARARRRARRPPLPDGVPAGRAVHRAVRPLRRLPHHRAGGRARAARVRLRPRRRRWRRRARCWHCCARSPTRGGRSGWPATPTRCWRSAAGCTPG